MDPLAVAQTVLQAYNALSPLLNLQGNAELKDKLADLKLSIATMKETMASLIDENRELRAEITKLNQMSSTEVTFKDGCYYNANGDGPFCTSCFDTAKQLIRLTVMGDVFHHFGKYRCNVCKNHYK